MTQPYEESSSENCCSAKSDSHSVESSKIK